MSTASGEIRGGDAWSRAVRLAGALAEVGAMRLVLTRADGATLTLAARGTDLPGLLRDAGIAALDCPNPQLHIEVGPHAIMWRTADALAAEAFEALA